MQFEVIGPAFSEPGDEVVAIAGVKNGSVVQFVRTDAHRLEIRNPDGGPEPMYVIGHGSQPGILEARIWDLLWNEFAKDDLVESAPLLYLWEVRAEERILYRYVGRSKSARRPRVHYRRNVRRYLTGEPYRRSDPLGFREVHQQLAYAVIARHTIELWLLGNVPPGNDIVRDEELMQRHFAVGHFPGVPRPPEADWLPPGL